MKGSRLALLLAILAITHFNCQRELSDVGGGTQPATAPSPVKANLQGNIIDEAGQPAAGVRIQVGSKTAITDSRGYFRIMEADLDKNASKVTAEKEGYFKAFRTFRATSGSQQVNIKLVKKTLTGTIASASGGAVTLTNGAKVALPANGVVVASGNAPYSGDVKVYAAYIDPTSADIAETVPGSFMADDKANNRVTLASYGMMAVELESTTGQKLQVRPGSRATLTMPIPSSILSSAPATIPLWYVDEATGLWKEEGSATKSGSQYIGEVSHFSFWNCDISIPAITLTVTLKTSHGLPLTNTGVRIHRTGNTPGSAYGVTDSLGQVSGLVPANENLVLEVIDRCNNVIYTQNIGPYQQAVNLGTINLPNSVLSLVTISGKVVNCAGGNVTNGHVILLHGNRVWYIDTDASGNFSVVMDWCSASIADISVLGVDETNTQQGTMTTVPLSSPTTNAGTLSACGTSSAQYLNYTLDGNNLTVGGNTNDSLYAYTNTAQTGGGYTTNILGANHVNGNNMSFTFDHPNLSSGTYAITAFRVQNASNTTVITPSNVVVTRFAQNIGDFYEGSFSGQYRDAANVTHSVSGTFRIMKQW